MIRRQFIQLLGGPALSILPFATTLNRSASIFSKKPKFIRPKALRPGSTIGLIAPASAPAAEKFTRAFANLEAMGFKVKVGEHLYAQYGYLAGTDAERVADLHRAFADPEVDAVWCVRGGYGCTRLLPLLDFDLIRRNPKPFIGFSDVTALHVAIHARTGLVSFHGPVTASEFPENTLAHFQAALIDGRSPYSLRAANPAETLPGDEYKPFVIRAGKARGPLVGGNLALLAAMAGTPWAPVFKNKLVFIEDIGEVPYRIDRLLTQLLQASDLRKAEGIALGIFSECQAKGEGPSFTAAEVLRERLEKLDMPIVYGLPFGHVAHNATLPYGIEAALDTEKMELTLLESGVERA